jgi:DNA-directed RNA polymerase subunit RPC12/RpoP
MSFERALAYLIVVCKYCGTPRYVKEREKGLQVLEVTFTYYHNDGKYLYKDDALVFNRTVTVMVE